MIEGLENDNKRLQKVIRDHEMKMRDQQSENERLRRELANSKKNEDFLMERVHTFEHEVNDLKKDISHTARVQPTERKMEEKPRDEGPEMRKKCPF